MMKFKKGILLIPFVLLAVLVFVGCDDETTPPGRVDNREVGPPLGEISFIHDDGGLGTVYKDLTPHFISGIGVGGEIRDAGYAAFWRINSTASNANLLIRNPLDEKVYFVTEEGSITTYGENTPPFGYAFSQFGSKIALIEVSNDTSRLYYKSLTGSGSTTQIAEVVAPWKFDSQPSINTTVGESGIIVREKNTSTLESRLVIYGITEMQSPDEVIDYVTAFAPKVSKNGSYFACLTGGDSFSQTQMVYIADWSNLSSTRVINFGTVSAGASDLAWSPDGQYIALIGGLAVNSPKLILVNIAMQTASLVDISGYPVHGDEDELYFNAPCWNDSSNAVTMLMQDESVADKFKVVRVNLLEETPTVIDLKTGIGNISFPQWRESDLPQD